MTPLPIEQFDAERLGPYPPAFARILQKTIHGGASLGFLPTLTLDDAEAYWCGVERSVARANSLLFGVLDADGVVATVKLLPSQRTNACHRAELAKLMVAPSHRRQHLAKRQHARNASGGLHTTAFYYKLLGVSAPEVLPTLQPAP